MPVPAPVRETSSPADEASLVIPAYYFLWLSGALFAIGAIGVLIRRNPLVIFMSIELMLNAVNLSFATFSRFLNSMDGVAFAFLVITVAAAEVVVGIAIIVQVYRAGRAMDVDELDLMKE
jgi:NADH-quinone oxidoreductase subunit K